MLFAPPAPTGLDRRSPVRRRYRSGQDPETTDRLRPGKRTGNVPVVRLPRNKEGSRLTVLVHRLIGAGTLGIGEPA